MTQSRQLSAIMFTDIVGYTALMGEDEGKAFDLLNKNRQLQKPLIENFSGKWVKELGDGVMASFSTVTDAVMCASNIQHSCSGIPGLQLRIGIHLGEVIYENNDVFGDGVNIAARLQGLAPVGGIFISESVQKILANKKDIETKFVSETVLKNVKEPVRIYEVVINDKVHQPVFSNAPLKERITAKSIPSKSIAVLPFMNLSNDPEQEYFSDGIAEEILNSLAHLKNLKVAGRSSSFQFKGKGIDLKVVGKKLNVKTVLEGSVRRQANKLRVTVQLINVSDGFHLWSERYDRDMDDIFAVQDEIAMAITEKLKVTLLDKEKATRSKIPTENKEAYDLYLKGRFYWNRRGPGLKKGLEYFLQAAIIDPQFGLAHAGIADAYALLALYSIVPSHIAVPKAKQAAEMAIALDPNRIEPHSLLAFLTTIYDFDWATAKKQFEKAIEINPGYAATHYWYSNFLSWIDNDCLLAIEQAKKAIELEPLLSHCYNVLSSAHLCNGTFEEARQASLIAVELDANSFLSYSSLSMSLSGLKKYDEAIEVIKKGVSVSGRHQYSLFELAWLYSQVDNIAEAQKILDELIMRSSSEFISGLSLCVAAYASKNFSKSVEYLELALEQRAGLLPSIQAYPVFSFIKKDPRFHALLKKMNFPK